VNEADQRKKKYKFRKTVNKPNQSNLMQSSATTPFDKEDFTYPRTLVSILLFL